MNTKITIIKEKPENKHWIGIVQKPTDLKKLGFSKDEITEVSNNYNEHKQNNFVFQKDGIWIFLLILNNEKEKPYATYLESFRKAGNKIYEKLKDLGIDDAFINASHHAKPELYAFLEGLLLSTYQFLKYKTKDVKTFTIKNIEIATTALSEADIKEMQILTDMVFFARDMVNEPLSYLTAEVLSEEAEKLGKQCGIKVEVLNKTKIQALKMGGLLAVNKGSPEPPTFTIMEYKPKNAKNQKPIIFVGKGIVFDTGGLSLKPSSSMEEMKCDMGGGAAVIGAIAAIAKAKLPVYVMALIPATENRPDGNAYVPGDIITMHSGLNVEVLNTDAEGRMILADALSYAKKYEPAFVIDLATLTGSAHAAVGKYAAVAMGSKYANEMDVLKEAGEDTYERIAEFPFWEEYAEQIKSDIADIKNVGSRYGGAITAGKFLEYFIDYPWIHLDIAGPVFTDSKDNYRGLGGTGYGVRLLYHFVKKYIYTK